MPQGTGKKLVIINNLDEFTDKLLNRIADESEAGRSQLISNIEQAKEKYSYWLYKMTRKRGPEVKLAIQGIESFPDAYTRLQEFKLLISKGDWKIDSSFNYFLFGELIKGVPGYKSLSAEETPVVIHAVKELIITKIDYFMASYLTNQKLIEKREEERKVMQQSVQKSVDNVCLINLDEAKTSAIFKKNIVHFNLVLSDNKWKLSWIDLTGKAYILEPGEELVSLLVDQNIKDVAKLTFVQENKIKNECLKARDTFLNRVELLFFPQDKKTNDPLNNEAVISKGKTGVFVLRGKPKDYSLEWINTLGKVVKISLDDYPQLKQWINGSSHQLKEEQIPNLKAYLLQVKTSESLGMGDFKNKLMNCLKKGPATKPLVEEEVTKPVNTLPKKLDMALFANVEKCLGQRTGEAKPAFHNLHADEVKSEALERVPAEALATVAKVQRSKLNLENFGSVATLFAHRAASKNNPQEEIKSIVLSI